jgi:glycosyltransferase involved in cell wall biosynthesis
MKIAHIVDSMEVGGAETLVSQMCRLQREQGHEAEVYAVAALGPLGERLQAEGFRVQANVGRHQLDASWNFFRLLRASRPDVVHLHNPTPTMYAGPSARMAGVPSIVSTRHSLVAPPRNLTMERKYRIAAKFCDWIVGICDATTTNIRDAGSAPDHKIVRVYNGSAPIHHPAGEQCLPKARFTLLYVGRLEAVKNLGFLLEALCAARQNLPDIELWIVGDGAQRAQLEQRSAALGLEANVKFWGQQLEVARFFGSVDTFIMSSISEGLPMSLLQALSAGLPAIVTDVGGMAEVVRLSRAGLVVPVGDTDAMAAAIVQIAASHEQREAFSQNAKAGFQSRFTLPVMVEEYMRLYRDTPRARRVLK